MEIVNCSVQLLDNANLSFLYVFSPLKINTKDAKAIFIYNHNLKTKLLGTTLDKVNLSLFKRFFPIKLNTKDAKAIFTYTCNLKTHTNRRLESPVA